MPLDRTTPISLTDNLERDPDPLGRVVRAMREFAHKGKADPEVIGLCNEICAGVQSGDYASQALACYYWVHQNVKYARDPAGVEMVQEPRITIEERMGDCDDMATLLAAMLMRYGHRCYFTLVSLDEVGPPSHVYVDLLTPTGLVTFDPVANKTTYDMLGRVGTKKRVRV